MCIVIQFPGKVVLLEMNNSFCFSFSNRACFCIWVTVPGYIRSFCTRVAYKVAPLAEAPCHQPGWQIDIITEVGLWLACSEVESVDSHLPLHLRHFLLLKIHLSPSSIISRPEDKSANSLLSLSLLCVYVCACWSSTAAITTGDCELC